MERIRTRIIIAVAERLSEAKDSDAKTELIEELSENLYQRYMEQIDAGVEHEEAYRHAMEELGDVSELLEYLEEREYSEAEDEAHRTRDHVSDFLEGIDDVVRETVSQTKEAVKYATAMARDFGEKAQKKCSDVNFSCGYNKERGFFWESTKKDASEEAVPVPEESIPAEQVKSLDILLNNGKVDVSVAEQDAVTVGSSGEELDVRLNEDGVLFIRQGKTASSAVMHECGIARTDVALTLPVKVWERIQIETMRESAERKTSRRKFFHVEVNGASIWGDSTGGDIGNITFHDALEAHQLSAKTNVGDISVNGVSCHTGELRSTSGDIELHHVQSTEKLTVQTASGDITAEDVVCPTVELSSTSGDMELHHAQSTEKLTVKTASGDITIEDVVCPTQFFKSASGDIHGSGLRGDVKAESMSGDVVLQGELGKVEASSVSGDVEIGETFDRAAVKSTSGDVNVASSVLPQELKVSSVSGDCTVQIPDGEGFSVRMRSSTGDWNSEFALVRDSSGNAIYLDGGDRNFSITAMSGDVSLKKY